MKKRLVILFATFLFLTNISYSQAPTQEEIQRYNLYYNNGVSYLKNKRYSSAIVEFKKVLRYQPNDAAVKEALCTSYLARADYFLNEEKNPKKAINDLRSALFYMKYWNSDQNTPKLSNMINSTLNSLVTLEKKHEGNLSATQRLQRAKDLRVQGELPAAGYILMSISNNSQYAKEANETAGDIFKTLNNPLEALKCYREAINADKKNAKLHFKYAVILDEANNQDAAIEEYSLALKYGEKNPELLDILENLWRSRTINNPNDTQAYINMGTVLQTKGDLAGAKAQYLKALSINPNDKTAILNLSSLYIAQGSASQAIALYDKLLAKNPNNIEIIKYKAAAYEAQKNYKNALLQYQAILDINPDNQDAKAAISDIIANKFTPEEKYNYMLLQANSNPQNYDLQYAYAYEMHKQKRYDEAISYYKKALSLNPRREETYINIAQIYALKNDFDNALLTLNKGIANIPYSAQLLKEKDELEASQAGQVWENATKFYEQKDYKTALANYLKIQNQTPEVQLAIAACYWELKDYKNAIIYYEKYLQKEPKNEEVLYLCAMSYDELGNEAKSVEILNKILSINPQNENAKQALLALKENQNAKNLDNAISMYEKKQYKESLALLDKVLEEDNKNYYAYYYKGLALEEEKNLPKAIENYKAAIANNGDFSPAYYSYALALDNSEKYQEAVTYYDKYLELRLKEGTQDEYSKFAKERVAQLREFLNSKQ